ncbi:MAG TPA: amidohydrolase [Bacteroidia bacterium]|jgi:predicted amidohydrolase YtcJ
MKKFNRKDAKTQSDPLKSFRIALRLCAFAVPSLLLPLLLPSCSSKPKIKVDSIFHHGVVYTVDSVMSVREAFAVRDGKIVEVSSNDSILTKYEAPVVNDLQGKAVFPGFIDSHCHFYNYGLGLNKVDLIGTRSFDEVIERVVAYAKQNKFPPWGDKGGWIIGRGWDQNDWVVKEFPNRRKLDSLFPNTPVILKRVDGHATLANSNALMLAGITPDTKVSGGEIELIIKTLLAVPPRPAEFESKEDSIKLYNSKRSNSISTLEKTLTGILIDNAVDLVEKVIPGPSKEEMINALLEAQKNCFAVGLTTVDDAGLMKNVIDVMDEMQKRGDLKMRIYAMLSDSAPNYDYYMEHGPYKTDRLDVRSFKFYADGALGSRGACLLQDYSDKPGWKGFLLSDVHHFEGRAPEMIDHGFQMNTHCIGDSACRVMLSLYEDPYRMEKMLNMMRKDPQPLQKKSLNDIRWRIEHFQVTNEKDIEELARINGNSRREYTPVDYVKYLDSNYRSSEPMLIPSVQPTHATSDMYWAKDRLGPERIKYAYAYKDLLKAAGLIALGTDFPVEDISPFKTFYAAVARMDEKGWPEGGFQPENALTHEETLRGMTIWGAFANFEEKEKGSLEKGKFADFVILDTDIMKCDIKDVLKTQVLYTYVNGENVYTRK